jgi:hypothetical protein
MTGATPRRGLGILLRDAVAACAPHIDPDQLQLINDLLMPRLGSLPLVETLAREVVESTLAGIKSEHGAQVGETCGALLAALHNRYAFGERLLAQAQAARGFPEPLRRRAIAGILEDNAKHDFAGIVSGSKPLLDLPRSARPRN